MDNGYYYITHIKRNTSSWLLISPYYACKSEISHVAASSEAVNDGPIREHARTGIGPTTSQWVGDQLDEHRFRIGCSRLCCLWVLARTCSEPSYHLRSRGVAKVPGYSCASMKRRGSGEPASLCRGLSNPCRIRRPRTKGPTHNVVWGSWAENAFRRAWFLA